MSDQFAREVDEDLRSEYLKSLWDRFGLFIIGAALLVVLLTAGYRGYSYFQERSAQTAGDAFMDALQLSEDGDTEAALSALNEIAAGSHNGYAALARFRIATQLADAGDTDGAIAAFEEIVATSDSSEFRDLANLRAAAIEVDTASLAEVQDRLAVLLNPNSQWRHSARELVALAAIRANDLETATSTLDEILDDAESLQTVRGRAEVLKTFVDGRAANE